MLDLVLVTFACLFLRFALCQLQFGPLSFASGDHELDTLDFASSDRALDSLNFATHFLSLKAPDQQDNAIARDWHEDEGPNIASVEEEEKEGPDLLQISRTMYPGKGEGKGGMEADFREVEGDESRGKGRWHESKVSLKRIQAETFDPGKGVREYIGKDSTFKVDEDGGWLLGRFDKESGGRLPKVESIAFQDRADGGNVNMNLGVVEKDRKQTAQIEGNVGDSRSGLETIEEEDKLAFERLLLELPLAVEKAREEIIEDIARRNHLGYTIAVGFFCSAILESIALMFIEDTSSAEPASAETLFWTLVTIWSYNAGFAWSYLFPDVFGAGSTNLSCSGQDAARVLRRGTEARLRSQGEVAVVVEQLRRELQLALDCVLAKQGKFELAARTGSLLDELIELYPHVYQVPASKGLPDPTMSTTALDGALHTIWNQFPLLVEQTVSAAEAMRAYRNTLYSLGALFTILGQLGGTLWILSSMNIEEFSTFKFGGFDTTMLKIQEFLSSGNVATDLKLGEIFGLLGVTASGYSYNMQYLVLVEEVELTCGLEQLEIVGAVFPNLAWPAQLIHAAGSELKGRRMVAAWRREMRNSLHCLVTTEEGTLLADTIEMYAVLVNRRLDFL